MLLSVTLVEKLLKLDLFWPSFKHFCPDRHYQNREANGGRAKKGKIAFRALRNRRFTI